MALRVGLIGCGAIGSSLALFIQKELKSKIRVDFLYDLNPKLSRRLSKRIKGSKTAVSLKKLAAQSDFLIEAASPEAAAELIPLAIRNRKPTLLMSGGGLITHSKLIRQILSGKNKFYAPSGAIPGVDALLASKEAGVRKVTLVTSKSAKSLEGAPFFKKNPKALSFSKEKKIIFEGNVVEAVRHFPKNINVSALLAVAGVGPKKTKVKIVACKKLPRNKHEIQIESKAGSIYLKTENLPHPLNPRTSALAIYSAQALLRKLFSPLSLGT